MHCPPFIEISNFGFICSEFYGMVYSYFFFTVFNGIFKRRMTFCLYMYIRCILRKSFTEKPPLIILALISEIRFLPAKVQFKTRAINLTNKIRSGFKRMRCIMSMNSEKRTIDIITCMSIKKDIKSMKTIV